MKIKDFFRIILESFYSVDLYINVISKWQHWGLNFLIRFSFLVTLIASIFIFLIVANIDFNSDTAKSILSNIPELKISNNKASFVNPEIKSPIHIQPSKSVLNLIIIDLDTTDTEKYKNSAIVTFLADKIVANIIQDSSITLSYDELVDENENTIVDGDFILKFLNAQQKTLLSIIIFVGIPLGSLIYFALTILKLAFYSSIATLICLGFKLNLSFKQLTRLAIIANIPSVIVSSFFAVLFFQSGPSDAMQMITASTGIIYYVGAIALYLKRKKSN